MEGWIKIHRSIEEWEWEGDPLMYYFWVRLLVRANYEDTEWRGITVPRGSIITSLSGLAHDMHLSVRQVRTYTERLTKRKQIAVETTNRWTKITICKYDNYQGSTETKCQTNDTQGDKQNVNQRATNKEDKNKEYNNITLTNAPAREETWRFISSVRRSVLNNNPDNIANFKKELFRREVEANVSAAGMSYEQKEKFIGWWTEHTPGSEKIRAEYEAVFNTLDRMKIWMDRNQPKAAQGAKGRMDQLEDDLNFISNFFNGQQSSTTAPDEQ